MPKKLNNKGYMLVEIIVASVIAFSIAYYLLNLTYKFKDKNMDIYESTSLLSAKINITKSIMNDLNDKKVENIIKINDKFYKFNVEEIGKTVITKCLKIEDKKIIYGTYKEGNYCQNDENSLYYEKTLPNHIDIGNIAYISDETLKIPIIDIYGNDDYIIIATNNYNWKPKYHVFLSGIGGFITSKTDDSTNIIEYDGYYNSINTSIPEHNNSTSEWKDLNGGNNATITNGNWGADYLEFDGNTKIESESGITFADNKKFTIECTFLANSDTTNKNESYLLGNVHNNNGKGIALKIENGIPTLAVYFEGDSPKNPTKIQTNSKIQSDVKYHLVGSYDGNNLKIFVNGKLKNIESITKKVNQDTSHKIIVGTNPTSGSGGFFKGRIYSASMARNYISDDIVAKSAGIDLEYQEKYSNKLNFNSQVTREGIKKTFGGWFLPLAEEGLQEITEDMQMNKNQDHTIYAKWQ